MGEIYPQYINDFYTKRAKAQRSLKSIKLSYLTDIGIHCTMIFKEIKPRGSLPRGYSQQDLSDEEQLAKRCLRYNRKITKIHS